MNNAQNMHNILFCSLQAKIVEQSFTGTFHLTNKFEVIFIIDSIYLFRLIFE